MSLATHGWGQRDDIYFFGRNHILKRLAQLSSDYHLNYHIVVERYRHESNHYGIGVKGVAIG